MTRAATVVTSIVMTALALSAERVYVAGAALDDAGICLHPIYAEPLDFFAVEGLCALPDNKPNRHRLSEWSVVWNFTDSAYSYASLAFDYRHAADEPYEAVAEVEIGRCECGVRRAVERIAVDSGLDFACGFNSLAMEWSDGVARVYAGNRGLRLCVSMPEPSVASGPCGLMSGCRLDVADLVIEKCPQKTDAVTTGVTIRELAGMLAGAGEDPVVGLWEYLDRVNDPAKARLGGRYSLAVVPAGDDGGYAVYYVGGAEVGASKWIPGMLKGRLVPTVFVRHYGLEWWDATFDAIRRDIYADVDETGTVLTLCFPLMETTLRFSRSAKALSAP